MSKKNQSIFIPDVTIDLQACSQKQAAAKLKNIRGNFKVGTNLRIVVGKGAYSNSPPVMPTLAKKMLGEQNIDWSYAKQSEGGDGALDCAL